MARFLLRVLIFIYPLIFISCAGPLLPEDPFYLKESKDALGRANYWYLRGCYQEAERYYALALEQARLADNVSIIVMALNGRGTVLLAKGSLSEAAVLLERAIELSQSQADRPGLDGVWGNLGLLAFKAGRVDDARDFWQKAAEEARLGQRSNLIYLCNLARLEMKSGDEAKWKQLTAQAMEEASKEGAIERDKADAYNLNALLALKEGRRDEAESWLKMALELDRKNENQFGLANDLEALGSLEKQNEQNERAAASFDRAFYLFAALGDREAQKRILKELEALNSQSGFPKSLTTYRQVMAKPNLFDPINRQCP
ncbi:MAG: hypothetical protein LBV23_07995 [Deltaproteobacteria bacterium]|jgi:tetratricopeptide (TPR) repeat protein|nr:hypothetical protein [Deltaproteobacteria bacterium]